MSPKEVRDYSDSEKVKAREDNKLMFDIARAEKYVTLRKSTSLRMKRRLKVLRIRYRDYQISLDKVFQTIASYTAMMRQCNCKLLEKKILDEYVLTHNREDI